MGQNNIIYSLRPKQWIKNLFLFLPLIFGGKLFAYPENMLTGLAFLLFSIVSGVAYLLNDVIDYDKDRHHPTKQLRPIASGKLRKETAVYAAMILGSIVIALAFLLNYYFGLLIITYLIGNFLYSIRLKHAVIIDVFCIGAFFLLRVIAGSLIARVEVSHWLIIMTSLLALFLGFNKRRQEIQINNKSMNTTRAVLEKYDEYFIDQMIAVITSSIVIAYMLYTVDARTIKEFGSNHLLFTTPFVYYGIFRYLYLIHKHNSDGDPTRILLSDKSMQINILIWIFICIFIIYFRF